MKKNLFILLIALGFYQSVWSQNIGINPTGATPAASAMLDVSATDKGLLIPRVALTATNTAGPITSPATSLLVYNTATAGTIPNNVIPGYYYWNGSAWVALGASSSSSGGWTTAGNTGTTAGTNFLGTTDAIDLVLKTNNVEKTRITSSGNVGIGTSTFDVTNPEKFVVNAGTTSSVNAIVGKGNINSYLQLNIQNNSTGTSASSDVVATADNGSETTNYVDMGINSSANTSGVMGAANDAYLYNIGQNLLLGTGTPAKSLIFMTGGTAQASNERMRISGTGKVGIGNTSPSEVLDVTGNVKFSGALMPNNLAGTSGYLLQSGGAGTAPTWVDPASVVSSSTAWAINGNNVTGNRNLGTISNFSLPFITNNIERMRITNLGNVGVGTTTFDATNPEKFIVDAGTTSSVNAIVGKGSINNYLQLNIQNKLAGTNASSDVVATADNGTETTNYIDMGVNSSVNSSGVMGGANDGYIYNIGQNLLLASGTVGKSMIFMTGGTSQATNERMRISSTGKVGIGNNAPSEVLDITGNLKFSGAIMPNNAAGSAGDVLQSSGAGVAPTWINPSTYLNGLSWALDGNAVAAEKDLGTTSNFALPFITNNTERMRITNTGNIGVGTSTFDGTYPEKFVVNAGTTSSVNAIVGKGNINNYLQLNIQNQSTGTNASSDVVATADNGSETTNYIDMGVNGSSNASGIMGVANDSYLYNMGQNLLIGTGSVGKSLVFMTGGTTQSSNERMRINGSGMIGIASTNPTSTLTVTGSIATAFRSGTGAYTVLATDHVVINTGGAATWTMPAASGCPGRIYRLVNQGTGNITLSRSVRTDSGTTSTTLVFAPGASSYEIISDGTEWRKIN